MKNMLKDLVSDPGIRKKTAGDIVKSIGSIGMDQDALDEMKRLCEKNPVYEIYISLFGIVRLAGLYEVIQSHTPERHMRVLNDLYEDLNRHLMGIEQTTCAKSFASKWAARILWYSPE